MSLAQRAAQAIGTTLGLAAISTTQFALAGLSAAKGFYSVMGESLDFPRIPLITASLDKISAAYAANGKLTTTASGGSGGSNQFNTCGAGCTGHGYQQNYGPGNTSSQQTASGTWGQLTGTGKTVNDTNLQGYLRWWENPGTATPPMPVMTVGRTPTSTTCGLRRRPTTSFRTQACLQTPAISIQPAPACPALAPCRPSGPGK